MWPNCTIVLLRIAVLALRYIWVFVMPNTFKKKADRRSAANPNSEVGLLLGCLDFPPPRQQPRRARGYYYAYVLRHISRPTNSNELTSTVRPIYRATNCYTRPLLFDIYSDRTCAKPETLAFLRRLRSAS